jgi:drug/metabolite transporter (DMT)-like permease
MDTTVNIKEELSRGILLYRNTNASLWLTVFGLILAMLIWGSSFIAMKIALTAYHPLLVVLGRMLTASFIFLLLRKRFGTIRYQKGDWKLLGLMALCEPCLYFTCETYALVFTSASEASMITGLLPLMTAVAARYALGEKLSAKTFVGFVVAFCGIVALTLAGKPTENAPQPLLGNSLELIAMACATVYTLLSRVLSTRYSALFITAVQAFVGSVFFLPVTFFPSTYTLPEFSWLTSSAIIYLGGVVSVVAYFLYNHALSKIPASQVSPYVNLIPVFSLLLGWLILDEQLTQWQYLAATVVVGGALAAHIEVDGFWRRRTSSVLRAVPNK